MPRWLRFSDGAIRPSGSSSPNACSRNDPKIEEGVKDQMEYEKVVEKAKNWVASGKKTLKKEDLERIRTIFDRFYLGNKSFVDKEAYDKARKSAKSMGELMVDTVEFLNAEIFRLEKKRRKLPVDNLQLKEAQKANEMNLKFIREFLKEIEGP
jgi:hypothetical protein